METIDEDWKVLSGNEVGKRLTVKYGKASADGISEAIDSLLLAQPSTLKEGRIGCMSFFVNKPGVVVKIEPYDLGKHHRINHPFVLQPIWSHRIGNAMIEIMPAIPGPAASADCQLLREVLQTDNINFADFHEGNCGYLPVGSENFPYGIPVVWDRDALRYEGKKPIRDGSSVTAECSTTGLDEAEIYAQRGIYGELSAAFEKAWPANQEKADPALIKSAWLKAQELYDQKILQPFWRESKDIDSIGAKCAANWYDADLNNSKKWIMSTYTNSRVAGATKTF